MTDGIDKSTLTDEQVAYIEELEEFTSLVDSALEDGTLVKAEAPANDKDQLLSKADPELAEYISKQDAQLTEMAETLAKSEAREAQRDAVAKAENFDNLDQAVLAEIFLALPAEIVEKVETVLTAANAAAANASAFVEVGKNFLDASEEDSLGAEVKAVVEKTEGLTEEQALLQVMSADPSRYDALMQEGN